ncbi:carbon-nitrogen family hydrolase [Paenibacillus sp. 481]|uniref:carbon-nitrogen family hydrolase n=1 Tax=Paenibacillus sp. 481 TaxID=2835869 RepID=UPI0022B3B4AB|nr:carbon-nitrogen family hydrolase [Paenibacillus sp. 481]
MYVIEEQAQQQLNQEWNVCVIQMDVRIGDPEHNFAQVEHQIREAMERSSTRPDVIVLPEMWNTGYALERIHELADLDGQRTQALLSELSQRYQVNIVGGSVAVRSNVQSQANVTNTVYITNRNGEIVATYSKTHLFKLMNEHLHLTAGDSLGTFSLDGVPCAVIICYDLRFPELVRTLALQGSQVLFVPAQWPHPRLHHWRTLLTARAIENQMYVVACNRVGTSIGDDGASTAFFGHSVILNPWGETVAEGQEEAEFVTGQLSLPLVEEVRARIPVFADRRESLYQ